MAKKARKTNKRAWKSWTAEAIKELRGHSKAKTPVAKLEKLFKRSASTLRQKAYSLGLSLGHQRRKKRI